MIVLDTIVLSELMKPAPTAKRRPRHVAAAPSTFSHVPFSGLGSMGGSLGGLNDSDVEPTMR